jgi:hypothetical protein
MRSRYVVAGTSLVLLAAGLAMPVRAQLPLAGVRASGQTVTPAYEGWYRNSDGSYSLSFGYLNRNSEEVIEIPIGPNNFIEPGPQNQGQPTRFEPRRHWGVFAVRVPADFGKSEITWTLIHRGTTFAIPGNLHRNWEIDALEGEAGAGNTPPLLRVGEKGPEGRGPLGVMGGPVTAKVDVPVTLSLWASDDGRGAASVARAGRAGTPVTITWFKHQGPGAVTFATSTGRVNTSGGEVTTTATFSEPGEYVIRARANDSSGVAGAGHAQCCWSNAFVKVTVTR